MSRAASRLRFPKLVIWFAAGIALAAQPVTAAEQSCECTVSGPIEVSNFPSVQHVVVDEVTPVVTVRETDLTAAYSTDLDLGKGEKRVVGPFRLDGRHRVTVQVSILQPRTNLPQPPLTVKWLVRFHSDDVFFDPCGAESGSCRTGFPRAGTQLQLAPPAQLADLVDKTPVSAAPVSIVTADLVGAEGLLVVDNTGNGARTVRVNTILDR